MITPVLLIVYRRPEATRRAMDAIAQARPSRLFVAADGPRGPDDEQACAQARAIATSPSWPCEVRTNLSSVNMGARERPMSAISWFFGAADAGIVIEDDIVASPDFFRFCEAMLERYAGDDRVMHISGESYRRSPPDASYWFSKYALTWGWATWRRAWVLNDPGVPSWPAFRRSTEFDALWDTADERAYWTGVFDQEYEGRLGNTWDYTWWYACMRHGLSIHPSVNLVTNIGSGATATHTMHEVGVLHRGVNRLDEPLRHPGAVARDPRGDIDTFDDRLVGGALKRQRTFAHQAGRPWRWLRRRLYRS